MISRNSGSAQARNLCFDGLRGIAALSVLLFHLSHLFRVTGFDGGYLAVDFFFVLSGLVIWRAYEQRLSTDMSIYKFIEVRLIRIYPLYLAGVMLGLARALGAILIHDPRGIAPERLAIYSLINLFLLPVPLNISSIFPLNAPAWSLSLEFWINVAFAVWLFRWKASVLTLVALCGAALMITGAVQNGNLNLGVTWQHYHVGVGRALWGFCAGVLLARMPQVTISGPLAVLVTVTSMILLLSVLVVPVPLGSRMTFDLAVALILFPAIVWLVSGVQLEGRFGRACGAMGDISYPLYATHYPLLLPIVMATTALGLGNRGGIVFAVLVCSALAVLLAALDKRIRAAISRRLHIYRTASIQRL
jgi:peptidoglycan/LPS O-acetylase OafA/YrhL